MYTTNQDERRSSATHLLARWEHERTTVWWSRARGGGPAVIPTAGIHYKLRRVVCGLRFTERDKAYISKVEQLTDNRSALWRDQLLETVRWSSGCQSADPAVADGDNEDGPPAPAAGNAGGYDGDEDAVRQCSSIARARRHSSTARLDRPISDSRNRCSTDRERRQNRRSTPCRTTL